MLRGMWDLPGPGLEPVSPALAGRFLTTAPPGKSPFTFLFMRVQEDADVIFFQECCLSGSSRNVTFSSLSLVA